VLIWIVYVHKKNKTCKPVFHIEDLCSYNATAI